MDNARNTNDKAPFPAGSVRFLGKCRFIDVYYKTMINYADGCARAGEGQVVRVMKWSWLNPLWVLGIWIVVWQIATKADNCNKARRPCDCISHFNPTSVLKLWLLMDALFEADRIGCNTSRVSRQYGVNV